MPRDAAHLAAARLPAAWFQREASDVARSLLGCVLVHRRRAGVIVEAEAYGGPEDLASHARFGPTPRTQVMFGPGGIAYVYLCYGIHQMFNVVTGPAGSGQAVLIRAIAPYAGFSADAADAGLGRGPGKVTTALGIDRRHDRRDLAKGALYIAAAADDDPHALEIAVGPRIGVAYAGAWAAAPLRFWWRDHPSVSGARSTGAARGTLSTRRKR